MEPTTLVKKEIGHPMNFLRRIIGYIGNLREFEIRESSRELCIEKVRSELNEHLAIPNVEFVPFGHTAIEPQFSDTV